MEGGIAVGTVPSQKAGVAGKSFGTGAKPFIRVKRMTACHSVRLAVGPSNNMFSKTV